MRRDVWQTQGNTLGDVAQKLAAFRVSSEDVRATNATDIDIIISKSKGTGAIYRTSHRTRTVPAQGFLVRSGPGRGRTSNRTRYQGGPYQNRTRTGFAGTVGAGPGPNQQPYQQGRVAKTTVPSTRADRTRIVPEQGLLVRSRLGPRNPIISSPRNVQNPEQ